MDVRTGRRLRVGEALLAVGLTRMTRTSPLAYVVGRAAMRAVRMAGCLGGDGRGVRRNNGIRRCVGGEGARAPLAA